MGNWLAEIRDRIAPPDEEAQIAARQRWNAVAKPIGSLGALETMVEGIAALVGTPDVDVGRRIVVVFCADNGVVAQGVSQCGSEITSLIAGSIAAGTSSVCKMAHAVRADAVSVDVGMATPSNVPGVINRRIAAGTADISIGPAMSRAQAVAAIRAGVEIAAWCKEQGYRILAAGEMGIGNTTTASAMAAAFFGKPVAELVGRGAGLSSAGLERKRAAVGRALAVNQPDPDDPLDVLAKLGGFDIAGMAGLFIGGAIHRLPVVIDGFISSIAAYTAVRLCPESACAMFASHVSAEPAAGLPLEALGLRPILHAGMHLGEGTGALCLFPLLDAALALYNGTTFEQAGMDAYEVGLA